MKIYPSTRSRGFFEVERRWLEAKGKTRSPVFSLAWFACALLLSGAGAKGATFMVNTTNDTSDVDLGDGICADINGKCSVRAAIMQANFTNAIGPSNTIIIPAGIYTLTRPGNDDGAILGDLDIAQPMTIQGAGAGLTIIDGNGAVTGDRVFQILSSARDTSLSGLTIRNGMKVAGSFDSGGGLYWDGGGGHLHLSDVIFENNSAHYGGGLYLNYSPTFDVVDLDHVVVRTNVATTAAGGGLCVAFAGSVSAAVFDLHDSQVYGNTAFQGGGAYFQGTPTSFGTLSLRIETTQIYSNKASHGGGLDNSSGNSNFPAHVLNCRLYGNAADSFGGGIENSGTLVLSGTTVDGNRAGISGGGIYNGGASVTSMTNSTISGNSVTNGSGGGIFNGATVLNVGGTINLLNCTIASNSAASGFGGGITNQIGTVNARNTIIAGNTAQSTASGPDFAGTLASTSSNYDLFGNNGGLLFSGGIPFGCVFNVNPLLGPLQDNGGSTPTHALLAGSRAIDAGRSIGLVTDQRGAPRPVDDPAMPNANPGDGSDIGAFEVFPQPILHIALAANNVLVSWPSNGVTFALEANTNLNLPANWSNVSEAPVVLSGQFTVTNSAISGNKFYRLKFP